jgi:hypothetical protein
MEQGWEEIEPAAIGPTSRSPLDDLASG